MTQISSGEIANPPRPASGLLGLIIKHREALEPGNRIGGNAAVQLLALSRALVEALGGQKGDDGQWRVEIGGGAAGNLERLFDVVGRLEQRFEVERETMGGVFRAAMEDVGARLRTLESGGGEAPAVSTLPSMEHFHGLHERLLALESVVATPIEDITTGGLELQPDPRILELERRNADLEKIVEELAVTVTKMENRAKPGPKTAKAVVPKGEG